MTAQTLEEYAAAIGAEVVDLEWDDPTPAPVRTKTACNIPGCECTGYVPEQYIYPFKHCIRIGVCNHTENSHGKADDEQLAKPAKKKARRA